MNADSKKSSALTRFLIERLHDPVQLRIVIFLGLVLGWYLVIYSTLSEQLEANTGRVEREKNRLALAERIEQLKGKLKPHQARLPEKLDATEYLQYVLGGIRALPLKVVKLDTNPPVAQGPYQVLVLRIEVEGRYGDLHEFLRWVEENPRIMRVDALKIQPRTSTSGGPGGDGAASPLTAQLTVLGILG